MARPTHTVLLLTASRVVRADFGGGPAFHPLGMWTRSSSAGGMAVLSDEALRLAPGCGRHVWVLAEDVWTQKLGLSRQSITGLSTAELAKALTYEVEPLSGIPSDQSILGLVPAGKTDDGEDFWITQASSDVVAAVESIVKQAGGKLSGIAHPGGLGTLVDPPAEPPEAWRRVEVWQQATFLVTGGAGRPGGVHIINSSSDQPSWQRLVQRWTTVGEVKTSEWMGELEPEHYLPEEAEPHNWRRIHFAREKDVGRFLQTWLRHLESAAPAVPLVTPRRKPATKRDYVRIGVLAGLLAVLLASGHALLLIRSQRNLNTRVQEINTADAQYRNMNNQIVKINQEIAEMRNSHAAIDLARESVDAAIARLSKRMANVLAGLGNARPEGVVVREIATKGHGEIVVKGIALSPTLADRYAAALEGMLGGSGLRVEPLEKAGQGATADGGPWSFSIGILPKTATSQPAAPQHPPAKSTAVSQGAH